MTSLADADELTLVRDTARQIARRCHTHSRGTDHEPCWTAVRDAGFTDLRAPDADGRALGSAAMAAAVIEELARSVCGAPLLGHLLACELLRLVAAGQPGPDEDLTVILEASWRGLANGTQGIAWDAGGATRGLARGADRVHLVPLGDTVPGADPTRAMRLAETASGEVVGRLGAPQVQAFANFARTMVAADQSGAAAGIFDAALGYVKDRVQFGVPVGSFQAVQHLCAQAYVDLEAIRSSLAFATRALDADDGASALRTSLVVKAFANDAAIEVVQAAMQCFGGIAITVEHPAHRHLRRVLVDREVFGTTDVLTDLLLDEVEV